MSDNNTHSVGMQTNYHKLTLSSQAADSDAHSIGLKTNKFKLTLTTPVGSGVSTDDYEMLRNKPYINGVELIGDLSLEDLGLDNIPVSVEAISDYELDLITGSASTEEAFDAILSESDEVMLGTDLTLTKSYTFTRDTVIDLNSFKLTSTITGYLFIADGVKLTFKGGFIDVRNRIAQAQNGGTIHIQNGSFNAGDIAFSATGERSKVVVDDGTIVSVDGCIGAYNKSSVVINGGLIRCTDSPAVFTNKTRDRGKNTITINGGEIVGENVSAGYQACGIYISNDDTLTVNGGTIKAVDGCGILMRAGYVTINYADISATGSAQGWVSDQNTIKMNTSAIIYHESANYPGKADMSLTIHGGKFVGTDNSVAVFSNESSPNITITDGYFQPEYSV